MPLKIGSVFLELLESCNCACSHCYAKKSNKQLSQQEWFSVIDKLKYFNIKNCVLMGGEVCLMGDKFYSILAYCISNFRNVSIQTNGTLPSYFQDYKCEVAVSFESCFKDKNDEIRRFANSDASVYDLAVKKLLAGKKYDNALSARITLYNDTDVLASIVFAEKLGSSLTLVPLMRQGCAENLIHRIPNAQKIREAMEICMEANERLKGHHEVQIPQWYLANLELFNKYKGLFLRQKRICPCATQRLFINSRADVLGCMFVPKPIFGNILKDKISVIEKNINEFNEKIKNIEPQGKCGKCDAVRFCGKGCVAQYWKNKSQMGNNCPMRI